VLRAVQKDGTVLYEGASGVRGIDRKDQPMTTDTLFWVASFTKVCSILFILTLGRGEGVGGEESGL
jgi:methyl acetate hydrolase